jgi:hypothetical protein
VLVVVTESFSLWDSRRGCPSWRPNNRQLVPRPSLGIVMAADVRAALCPACLGMLGPSSQVNLSYVAQQNALRVQVLCPSCNRPSFLMLALGSHFRVRVRLRA